MEFWESHFREQPLALLVDGGRPVPVDLFLELHFAPAGLLVLLCRGRRNRFRHRHGITSSLPSVLYQAQTVELYESNTMLPVLARRIEPSLNLFYQIEPHLCLF